MAAKGSGQFGPDVIVGSTEYYRKIRQKNPLPQKLANKRYLERQRTKALAVDLAVADKIPLEQALAEVEGRLQSITALRGQLKEEGALPSTHVPLNESTSDASPEIALFRDLANKHKIPYEFVEKVMNDDTIDFNDWEKIFEKESLRLNEGKE